MNETARLKEFSDGVGAEMAGLLAGRADERLGEVSDVDQLTAKLGAALIAVAEVLRDPIEGGAAVEPLVAHCSKWLTTLLEPVASRR